MTPSGSSPEAAASASPTPAGGARLPEDIVHPAASWAGKPLRREDDRWLARWLRTCADLARMQASHPMVDAVIEETDGRMIRVGDQWLADFASSGYLGLDLDQDIIRAVPDYLRVWGTHSGRPRLLGSPVLFEQTETALAGLVGTEDALVFPTVTHIHMSIIPVLAGSGSLFVDARADKAISDGCDLARGHGATVQRFRHADPRDLERLLGHSRSSPRVVCLDGVNGMTGNAPDIREFARIARRYDAVLYIDDSHGFGVMGERGPGELCDYGKLGNGVVRHFGEGYDNVVLVAGLSHAYSSTAAFIACPTELKGLLKTAAPPYLFSGPSSVASLATVLEGLKVNERQGETLRLALHGQSRRVLDALGDLGIFTPNTSGHPIIQIPVARAEDLEEVGLHLFRRGIYVTMATQPLVPQDEVGIRLQITAAHTDEQVERVVGVLGELSGRLRSPHRRPGIRLVTRRSSPHGSEAVAAKGLGRAD